MVRYLVVAYCVLVSCYSLQQHKLRECLECICSLILQVDVCADLVDAGWSIPVETLSQKVVRHCTSAQVHVVHVCSERSTLTYVGKS